MNIYRDIETRPVLEREYSPSSCVADLTPILVSYAQKSTAARASCERQVVPYGDHAAEKFDFFPPPSSRHEGKPRPVLIYIHGGYWQELSKDDHSFPAVPLSAHDVGYIAINYGLAPQATLTEMVERCRRALVWIAQHAHTLGIDPDAMHLAGCSAGGHLAAMTALTDWKRYGLSTPPLQSVTLLSGVFDLRPIPLTYVNDAVGMSEVEALSNSPLLLIDGAQITHPSTLIVWGDNETGEFKRQSREYAAALARKGVPVQAEEIVGRNHFDLIFDLGESATRFGTLTLERLK